MLHYLYQALSSPLGIVLTSDDPERLRAKLYALKREASDPALDALQFSISPTDSTQLWIVRKSNGSPSGE